MTRTIRTMVAAWLDRPTTRRAFLLPYLILALSVAGSVTLALNQARQSDAETRRRIEVTQYVTELNDSSACISRAEARDDLREAINGIFDFLHSIAGLLEADAIAEQILEEQARFNEQYTPIDVATCPTPPTIEGSSP